ncbi:hypothetical protein GO493_06495 [Chitinophaga sp. ysch24]|uniref:Beta-mannosidase-like galactose-binding domain-containing protein n=2 Tax=Chitinophaga tropicalis TaxID=2683588 RepID=A0A7K1U0N1_9BACT|nr:hypothetical protein [Chitinophaga tropicalis]
MTYKVTTMKRKYYGALSAMAAVVALSAITAFNGIDHDTVPGENNPYTNWFPYYDFNPATFRTAPRTFGPFTRWWLPGNDITSEELQREVRMLADHGFAGVEVQPLTQGLNIKAPKEQAERIYSWDTPSFYQHMKAIMQQAQKSGITVDMNGGSGWPLGGAFFDPAESMKTLSVSDTGLTGGQLFDGRLPRPGNNAMKPQGMMAMAMQKNPVEDKWAKIYSVIAARVVKRSGKQTELDPTTLVDLTNKVNGVSLHWQAPAGGEWRIVTSWVIPTGEKPSLIASSKVNYVIDHLDTAVVNKAYNYLLGARTGLPAYYGKPLRAIFNDSYEFHTDRIISPDFLDVFRQLNGYDIAPWLSAAFQKGYDHPTYLASAYPGAKPPFVFHGQEEWRLIYDYDRTVNKVFSNNFIRTSNRWMEARGLLHRTQAYGFPNDLIGCAGAADIPEAEQLYAEGSEGYLKLVSSGAHLYNRPVITQESFVSILRAEMTTPQKIKIWADKSFACGINQLIYHGTPYRYNNGEYGKEGWNTWSSPYLPFINFSTGMNESDPFFNDIKTVNEYLARCQYALRAGKPETDVLIYVPFIDFTEDQIAINPEEILNRGYIEGIEPDMKGFGIFTAPPTPINTWYKQLWKTVNELEAKGISWEFVNDDALQQATFSENRLRIAGNEYQALLLTDLPYIQMASARHINTMSKQGLPLWITGPLPQKQPSFLDYEKNDRLTAQLIKEASIQKNSMDISNGIPAAAILQKIKFADTTRFSRQIARRMADGSLLRFLWNKTDQWQTIRLNVDKDFTGAYWLNAEDGTITNATGTTVSYTLPPYGSVFLYASKNRVVPGSIAAKRNDTKDILTIDRWALQAGNVKLENSPLIDWRDNEQLKYCSDEGIYTATFRLDQITKGRHYMVDLGTVWYTANVTINGKNAGKRLFAPYRLDITDLVKPGDNKIIVRVTTTRRNGFIGEAVKKNPHYAQFTGKEKTIMASGLKGPVTIKELQ